MPTYHLKGEDLSITRESSAIVMRWNGAGLLQHSSDVMGPWFDEPNAESPWRVAPDETNQFYRLFYPGGQTSLWEPPMAPPAYPARASVEEIWGWPPLLPPPARSTQLPAHVGNLMSHELTHVEQLRSHPGQLAFVHLFSGEVFNHSADLMVRGRGFNFRWVRTYRHRLGTDTDQGHGWDHSYNLFIRDFGDVIEMRDGAGRRDRFHRQPDGTYTARQFFRRGRYDAGGEFSITFPDSARWVFHPPDSQPWSGKISRIVDRNRNRMSFQYNDLGKLTNIVDTLNRSIAIDYNSMGKISSLRDFSGRQVQYEYYGPDEPGGNPGDLKSVTLPATGNPIANPSTQNITHYTYTKGYENDRLNHLLLTITDPEGHVVQDHSYITQQNQSDLDFLRVRSSRIGYEGATYLFHYETTVPSEQNGRAIVKSTVNDPLGNVSEFWFDAFNQCVRHRVYTGRAQPGSLTTATENRPGPPLRPDDPPFYETTLVWNSEALPSRKVYPAGNTEEFTYAFQENPATPARSRANLVKRRQLPGPKGASQAEIIERWEHDPRFQSIKSYTDGRSHVWEYSYDEQGNLLERSYPLEGVQENFEYNEFGQLTAHVHFANSQGHRRRDELHYYDQGPQTGYLQHYVQDADPYGFNLTNSFVYNARGAVTEQTPPTGLGPFFTVDAFDDVVSRFSPPLQLGPQSPVRYETKYAYDLRRNLIRVDVQNVNPLGQVSTNEYLTTSIEYDAANRPIRMEQEVSPGVGGNLTVASFNVMGQLTNLWFGAALSGEDPDKQISQHYDERHLLWRVTRGGNSAERSTTQYDYDANGNLIRILQGIEGETRITEFAYDGYNRLIEKKGPTGLATQYDYDVNFNLTQLRLEGHLDDRAHGGPKLLLGRIKLAYDPLNRMVLREEDFFDPASGNPIGDGLARTEIEYAPDSQITSMTNPQGQTTQYQYDSMGRLSQITDPASNTVNYAYDPNSNIQSIHSVEKSQSGLDDQMFINRYTYDAQNRLIQMSDTKTNVISYAYDSRGNITSMVDPNGEISAMEYDGLNQLLSLARDLDDDGASSDDIDDPTIRQFWDNSSRLVQQMDPNGNVTRYHYDALDRLVRTTYADGTGLTNQYDVHDNITDQWDGNGSHIVNQYDLDNRLTNRVIFPGPGVASDTTFENFAYDSLGRLIAAEDDDSLVEFRYDSMSNPVWQRVNGTVTQFQYDYSEVKLLEYPGGRRVNYSYDDLNRLQSITDPAERVLAEFNYVGPDRLESLRYDNRTLANFNYNGLSGVPNETDDFGVKKPSRVLHLKNLITRLLILENHSYAWDRSSNLNSHYNEQTETVHLLEYDPLHRLKSSRLENRVNGDVTQSSFQYDHAGNLSVLVKNGVVSPFLLDGTLPEPADRQMNQYTTTIRDQQQFDQNGNLISMESSLPTTRTLKYDYANRLVSHTWTGRDGSISTGYQYDALGRRLVKSLSSDLIPDEEVRYFYGANPTGPGNFWQVLEEQDESGTTLATYLHGEKQVFQMERNGQEYFYHSGDQRNILALTDATGDVVERYEYNDQGVATVRDGTGKTLTATLLGNPYLFQGRRFDLETGFYVYGNRFMDPFQGRYISRDPKGIWANMAHGGNAYTFADNNPRSSLEPLFEASYTVQDIAPDAGSGHVDHGKTSLTLGPLSRSTTSFTGMGSYRVDHLLPRSATSGSSTKVPIRDGDRILFGKWSGTEIKQQRITPVTISVSHVEYEQESTDKSGILLRGIKKDGVERGRVIREVIPEGFVQTFPMPYHGINSGRSHQSLAYLSVKSAPARSQPFYPKYRPQFYFRTIDVTRMVMPGDNISMDIQLIAPVGW